MQVTDQVRTVRWDDVDIQVSRAKLYLRGPEPAFNTRPLQYLRKGAISSWREGHTSRSPKAARRRKVWRQRRPNHNGFFQSNAASFSIRHTTLASPDNLVAPRAQAHV